MKTYHLQIITGNKQMNNGTYVTTCSADKFDVIDGVYIFKNYLFDKAYDIVACYPIDRTIIYKITSHEQVETDRN